MVALVVSSLLIRSHPVTRDGVEGWLPLVEADVRDGSGDLTLLMAGREFTLPVYPVGECLSTRQLLPEGAAVTNGGSIPFVVASGDQRLFDGIVSVESAADGWRVSPTSLPSSSITVVASADEDAPEVLFVLWIDSPLVPEGVPVLRGPGIDGELELDVYSERTIGNFVRAELASSSLKAWLLAEYADSDDWHELYENPGLYVVEWGGSAFEFVVRDGMVASGGPAEIDVRGDLVVFSEASSGWGGELADGVDIPDWYSQFIVSEQQIENDAAGSSAEVRAAIESVQTHVGTYRDDLVAGGGSLDHDQVDYALSDFLPLRDRMAALRASDPDDGALADAAAQLDELIALAERFLRGEADQAEALLAPYRAVLRADKLSICLDRPPHEYRYLTSGKREIASPEELAAAPVWYFEGGGSEGGVLFEVSSWSVVGFHFDPDHTLVDRTETSGLGASAPSSAFP